MKNLIFKSGLLAVLLVFATSCDDFGDMNIDPNNTTSVAPETLLTSSLRSVSSVVGSSTGVLYAQQFTNTQYTDADRYATVNFDFNGWYTGPLANLDHIIELNTDEATSVAALQSGSNANQIAVARILKAYFYHHMTDRWGPLPYTQALQGRENFEPAYDSQEAIYDALFGELKAANAQMDGGAAVNGDFLLGGNMDMWKKFANSVRMIMALRLSEVNPSKAQAEFVDAMNSGVLASNAESVYYPYLSEANNQNPWFGSFVTRTDWALSDRVVNYMKPLGDPRLQSFGDPAPNTGEIEGMPFGIIAAGDIPNADISFPNSSFVRAQNSPIGVITYAQLQFSMAEAAQRGWISGDAATFYNEGIRASMEQWGAFDEAEFQRLIALPEVAYDGTVERIVTQKWVALFLQGYEAWSEWRRTGFPSFIEAPEDPFNGVVTAAPLRHGYPTSERDINADNYNSAVSSLLGGPDELTTALWWDQ